MYHFSNNTYGAIHCCIFKTTALWEEALHYSQNNTNYKQILCIFPKKNFERQKKIVTYLLSLDVWHLVRQICALRHCQFRSFHVYIACETSTFAIFSPSSVSLLFKGKFPKVLWEKGTSKRKKELGSDLVSCPLV